MNNPSIIYEVLMLHKTWQMMAGHVRVASRRGLKRADVLGSARLPREKPALTVTNPFMKALTL